MKLAFIPLGNLSISKTNMRHGRKAPDVTDILPSVRARGILQPVIVRPLPALHSSDESPADGFEIVAGARRFTAARIVADERRAEPGADDSQDHLLPCAILDGGDDADAVEASLIENLARLDADEVTQWTTFTRLLKEGRSPDDIAATFGLPEQAVKRVLALGNLLPRIRTLYAAEKIDRTTIRHLTLASKRQQQAWLALVDDPDARAPTGPRARAWLLGGQAIPTASALFDVAASGLATVADLFGEDSFFADADAFWSAQDAAIAARREAYLADGWGEVEIIPPTDYFHTWEHEKAPKRKGGRVYIDVRPTGEVSIHEGYVSRRDAERAARGAESPADRPARPEITAAQQTYVDLHRHAAVRAALTDHPGVALRLLVTHLIAGSPLWTVRREPQATRNDAIAESVENSAGEAVFDTRRRAVLALLGMAPDRVTVTGGNADDPAFVRLFLRLLDLSDADLGAVAAIAIGETLACGSVAVEAVGLTLGIQMAQWWTAEPAFFDLLRDRELLGRIVAEVAGETIAGANAKAPGKVLKRIINDHLDGQGGRTKVEPWVPKWMAFPPAAYTARGGVGSVRANAAVAAAKRGHATERAPEADAPDHPLVSAEPDTGGASMVADEKRVPPQALAA